MKRRKIFVSIAILFATIFIPYKVSAISNAVYVANEELYCLSGTAETQNVAGTVIYDCDNNILTLNGYTGGPIKYLDGGDLTVILEGKNTINSSVSDNGFEFSNSNVTLKGSGSIQINNSYDGIYFEYGDLIIDNTNITIQDIAGNGIEVFGGSLTFSGKLLIDSKIDEEEFFGYDAIRVTNDITIDGNLTIKNARSGIDANGMINFKSGNSSIKTTETAIHSAKNILMDKGTLDIEVLNSEGGMPFKYGINATGLLKISDGQLHVLVPKNNVAIVVFDDGNKNPKIEITENLEIVEKGYTISDIEIIPDVLSKTIAMDKSIANEVTIKAKTNYKYEYLKGKSLKFVENSIEKYELIIDGDYSLFENLTIEGLDLTKNIDYIIKEGSTIIKFTENGIKKLNQLKPGTYKVSAKYTNGNVVNTNLIIDKNILDNPETSDSIILSVIIGFISLAGLTICIIYINKKKKNNKK